MSDGRDRRDERDDDLFERDSRRRSRDREEYDRSRSDDRDEEFESSSRGGRSRGRYDHRNGWDEGSGGTDEDLQAIANYQKAVLFCILISIGATAAFFSVPTELRLVLLIVVLAVSVVSTVFVFKLAIQIYSEAVGITLGVLTLVPLVGMLVLLIVNQKATGILNRHGIRVGLMGANTSDVESMSRRGRGRRSDYSERSHSRDRDWDEDRDDGDDRDRRS